jgi:hypothetical protein
LRVKDVSAVQIDPGRGEIDSRNGWHCAIDVETGGVWALTCVAVQVELDSHTFGKAAGQPLSTPSKGRRTISLDRKCETVGVGVRELKLEVGYKLLDIYLASEEGGPRLVGITVG